MNKKEINLKNAYISENKQLPIYDPLWVEPNISGQIRTLCINLAQMFGDTNLNQTFTVFGNRKCIVRIEIEEEDKNGKSVCES